MLKVPSSVLAKQPADFFTEVGFPNKATGRRMLGHDLFKQVLATANTEHQQVMARAQEVKQDSVPGAHDPLRTEPHADQP